MMDLVLAKRPQDGLGIDPIYEYGHGGGEFQGNSVTGGLVYRGSAFPDLVGAYLFADFVSGNIWSLTRDRKAAAEVERIAGEAGIVAFGTDPSDGEVLLVDYTNNRLMRLAPGSDEVDSFPQTLRETGLFSDLTDLSPAPGVAPLQTQPTLLERSCEKEPVVHDPRRSQSDDMVGKRPMDIPGRNALGETLRPRT